MVSRRPRTLLVLLLLTCPALCACASGALHGATPAPPGSPIAAGGARTAAVRIKIAVPRAGAAGASRAPRYVSASTQSVAVVVTPPGATPMPPQLIACSAGTCNGTVGAPIGSDGVTVNLYDQPGGTGTLLSFGSTTVTVGANAANSVNLTFNPIVKSIGALLSSSTLNPGTSSTSTMTLSLQDPDGNTIVGQGSLVDTNGNPLTITASASETGGNTTTSISPATYTNAANLTGTYSYTGNSLYTAALTITSNNPAIATPAPVNLTIGPYKWTEFPVTANSGPLGITVGPDNNIWFTEFYHDAIGKITTNGTVTEYPVLAAGSKPFSIAAGPDGALWFTEAGALRVGRLTTDGATLNEWNVTCWGSNVTAGPDGNMWFDEQCANRVGRVGTGTHGTTLGTVVETSPLTGTGQGIVTGPDGKLWIPEGAGGNFIARLSTNGTTVTEWALSNQGWDAAVGPDGNIWWGENQWVGTITTAGTGLHEYQYPGLLGALGIAAGPDKNLWYTVIVGFGSNFGTLGAISTSGVLAGGGLSYPTFPGAPPQYTFAVQGDPQNIIVGPDGNLWFAELYQPTSKIGRFIF
jgi:virginiamycin B lyase